MGPSLQSPGNGTHPRILVFVKLISVAVQHGYTNFVNSLKLAILARCCTVSYFTDIDLHRMSRIPEVFWFTRISGG